VDIVNPWKKMTRPVLSTCYLIHNCLFTLTLDALKSELLIDIKQIINKFFTFDPSNIILKAMLLCH
jgi:hypothetical protein